MEKQIVVEITTGTNNESCSENCKYKSKKIADYCKLFGDSTPFGNRLNECCALDEIVN